MGVRWSDEDRHLGPFTWSWSKRYPHWHIGVRSRGEDDDGNGCYFRLTLWRWTLCVALPGLVQPHKEIVVPGWDAATIARLGRDWYAQLTPREFSLHLSEGLFSVHYGRQTMDGSTERSWSTFLPWTQWRFVRHSAYGLEGEHYWTEGASPPGGLGLEEWRRRREALEACPTRSFRFADYDGEEIVATTRIEEREWLFGEGWFKWLSWFRRPKVRRALDLRFSAEVGPDKGSWKGGMIGTGFDMLPGELHEAAFRRFCGQNHRSKGGSFRISYLGLAHTDVG